MGLFDYFRRSSSTDSTIERSASSGMLSPWSSGELQKLVWSDVFDTVPTTITREEALSIPSVSKARSVLLSLIADKPLRAYKGDALAPTQPAWMHRTDGDISPWLRMAHTLDDLMFHGWSLWAVSRGAASQVTNAARVPMHRWRFDENGRILVDSGSGQFAPVDADEVLLIPGPNEGLIAYGARSLSGAIALERAWVERAKNPIPQIDLHQTTDSGMEPAEAKQLVTDWDAARAKGATAFTPHDIEARALGQVSAEMFTEGRNNTRLDVANFFNLPASLLDGSTSTASLTYSTQQGDRNEVYDYAVPYWIGSIEGRLSQDDVVPAGQRIRFDFSSLLESPQDPDRPTVED